MPLKIKMKNLKQIFTIICITLLVFLISISCYTTKYNLSVFNKNTNLPEGVDSLVVAKSDSIIKYLFVDFASKQKAEKLAEEARASLNQADSIWRKLKIISPDSTKLTSLVASDSNSKILEESTTLLKEIKENLQKAEGNFLHSMKLNPFPLTTKDGLAQTYLLWANIERPDLYYEKAVTVFNDMIGSEKGEHLLFYKLAECYYQLKNWGQALLNYREAEKILLSTTFYADSVLHEASSNDSMKNDFHFYYLYSQAVCLARMYKAQESLAVLKKAKEKAPSLERMKIADRFEDWLNWDNGNIHAAEEKNFILELIRKENYEESVSRFEKLKNQLSDPIAIDEIEWRIAGLEFNYLNKKQHACERLLQIIKKNEKSSYYPPQLVSTYEKYVTDCGIMHYHLGMDYIQSADYKKAQDYLEQGAKLNWYGNYKCQLELAKLNKHDPQISLEIIEQVLHDQINLTGPEKLAALEIKLSALRKLGPQYLNETRQIYDQIRELQGK
jgi:tetratricopeptide (TPR) repeat protein